MNTPELVAVAAIAMLVTDVLSVVLVQAEAANRGWLAGIMDTLGWYTSIGTTTISVTALSGHNIGEKIGVLVFVGAANLFGTKMGQVTGQWLLGKYPPSAAATLVSAEQTASRDKGLKP